MINYLIDSYCYPTKLVVWGETDEYGLVFLSFALPFGVSLCCQLKAANPSGLCAFSCSVGCCWLVAVILVGHQFPKHPVVGISRGTVAHGVDA